MKRKFRSVVRRVVDVLLRLVDLPTYSELRDAVGRRLKSDRPYIKDLSWFYQAKSILKRSV